MFVTIINDCKDSNAFGRQATRAAALFDAHTQTIGVSSTLEAAGNLIDVLDASEGKRGVVLVNVAPRNGEAKKWENGTPFCYFYYQDTLVVSSIQGLTLSLVKKHALIHSVRLLDIPTVIDAVIKNGMLPKETGEKIITSQFRSYDFLPRVAQWIMNKIPIPHTLYPLANIPQAPRAVWLTDNFGNCKTTLLPHDLPFYPGKRVQTKAGTFPCFRYLKDVPNGKEALIVGSSGLGKERFLELVIQGGNAAEKFDLKPNTIIL